MTYPPENYILFFSYKKLNMNFKKYIEYMRYRKDNYFNKSNILRMAFALEILLFAFILRELSGISGRLIYLILIISSIPIIYEMCFMLLIIFRNKVKIDSNKYINPNFKDILKGAKRFRYIILLFAILLFFLSPIYLFSIMKYQIEDYANSYNGKSDLHKLSIEITKEYNDDANKTKAILEWFNRDSMNIKNTYGNDLLLMIYPMHIFTNKPYFCIRLIGHDNPLWVLKSRCGACEENAMLFMEMANAANLTVRSIHNHGEDHNWDEVLIDRDWIVVDPVQVYLSENITGFNISRRFYDENWSNISYVFALYPNGTIDDITYRYTNLNNLTVLAFDENQKLISNVSIQIFSNNRPDKKRIDTGINCLTDPKGKCEIKLCGGNYTIYGQKKDNLLHLNAETNITLLENENNITQLSLKNDQFW